MVKIHEELKMKSGLEIHQQLDTNKLFCNCPSLLRSDEPDFEISRKLHAVAGESGKIDAAAKYQTTLGKKFIYQGYDTTCLVELDEEPPREINAEALKIALQIAILLNCKIIPISQIMRKTVVNGSNTSGFQRTVMIARDGYVETSDGRVGIEGLFLEEDSARPIKNEGNEVTYRIDRLGIPLVEIATMPDIKSPEQLKEVALLIGDILRSCKVKRGIGTIRQDVNISIEGTNRVEIKGFQDPKMMVETANKEMLRQKEFLDKGEKNPSEVRNAMPDGGTEFLRPMPGEARMYPETDLPLLKISRNLINEVKKDLPKLKSKIEADLKKQGLTEDLIKMLFKRDKLELYKEMYSILDKPMVVAKILLLYPKDLSKKLEKSIDGIEEILSREVMLFAIENLVKKKVDESQINEFFEKVILGEDVHEAIRFEREDENVVEEKIMNLIKSKPGMNPNAYMGLVMKEFQGKVDGKMAMQLIQKYAK